MPPTDPPPPQVFEPLRTQPNAIEVFLLGLALFSAIELITRQPQPLSVDTLLGPIWSAIWATMLIAGGTAALIGLFWTGRPITGIALQQLGYTGYAIASLARGIALIAVHRPDEAPIIFAFALAAAIRVIQLEIRVANATTPTTRLGATIRRLFRRGVVNP